MPSRDAGSKIVSERVKRHNQQKVVAKPHDLTYKSCVDDGCLRAGFDIFAIDLYPKQRAWRYLYATPSLINWKNTVLPGIASNHDADEDPLPVQLVTEFYSFRYGHELRDTLDIRLLTPHNQSVWELKTPSLRLFGWFPDKNYFVVHIAEEKDKLQSWADYEPFIQEVVRCRENVVGCLPTHITSRRLYDVVSNRP